MSLWRQLTCGLRVLTRRSAADREVADELGHYLEEATAAHVAGGLSPEDARRAARLEAGNLTVVREQVRAHGWENAIATLLSDLRHGARRLRARPGFAAICALTLALGIGASTAIFSVVNPILFESLPYPDAGQVAAVWDIGPAGSRAGVTFGTYREVLARSRSFDAIATLKPWQPTLSGRAEPERLDGQRVSASYFNVLGTRPALGRDFTVADDQAGGSRVAILGDGLWRRRFAADPAVVGRPITLDGDSYTVIGVMPAGFDDVLAPSAGLWAPLQYDTSLPVNGREWGHHLRMVGRLRPGIAIDQARQELDGIARHPVVESPRVPWASLEGGFVVGSLQDDITAGVRPALLAILGAALLLLAIACVNVTNLLLAQGAQRRGEFALRAALGARRMRMIRQLLTESLLLAAIGGALGMVAAELGVRALVALSPPGLPRVGAIRVDGAAFAFAAGVTALIGTLVGLIPALRASRGDLHAGLQLSSRRTAGGHLSMRRAFVVAEVALAVALLVGAGLLLRSMQRLFAVEPGFDSSHVLAMQVQTSGHRFDEPGATHRFFARALEEVERIPDVASAGFTSQLPLGGGGPDRYGVHFQTSDSREEDRGAYRYAVTPGYFETLGVPLRRGRLLEARDRAGAPHAVLISESLAKRSFPGRDPVGRRLQIGAVDGPWYTIAGVVGDVKQMSLAVDEPDAVYVTNTQWTFADRAMWLVVRARGDAAALVPAVERAIWSADRDQPIVRIATMDDLVAASAAERRFALVLFEAFGIAALLLAAAGIYGVLSGSVSERTRELGVRLALGASPRRILTLVLWEGMAITALGLAIGLGGALAASRAVAALLYGVTPLDPITYVGVATLLGSVSAIACWVPARRAAHLDPSITLRAE